jgi:hypothetical protein
MGENQSVDLSQNLDRLLTYISQLVPKDDSKFVEGMVKEIVYRFKEDKIGQELLMHLLESLPKTIDKYSDIMQKKRESKFGIGYLIKDAAKKAADVGLIDDIKYTKEEIHKKIEELKEIRDELYNTLITTSATLNEISAKSLKPNITDEEIKKLSERWTNSALSLYIEATRAAYKANKTEIGYDLIYFTTKKLTYELLFRFHRSPEDAYNKGIEFAEKEIIPMFEEVLNELRKINDIYISAVEEAKSYLRGRISDELLKNLEEKIKNPVEYYRLKRYLSYSLAIFVLIGSSLFLIGSKETTMAVLTTNNLTSFLAFGILVLAILLFFKFYKK